MTNIFATFNHNLNPLQIVFHLHGDKTHSSTSIIIHLITSLLADQYVCLCHVAFITLALSHVACDM